MLSPLTRVLIPIAAIAAIGMYARSITVQNVNLLAKTERLEKEQQDISNTLLAERLARIEVDQQAKDLQDSYHAIDKQNRNYKLCISNGTCGVRLRNQTDTNTCATTADDDTSGGNTGMVQQDIFDLRASILKDEAKIAGLQRYINTVCHKPTN